MSETPRKKNGTLEFARFSEKNTLPKELVDPREEKAVKGLIAPPTSEGRTKKK